jgi:hypothetical protein
VKLVPAPRTFHQKHPPPTRHRGFP